MELERDNIRLEKLSTWDFFYALDMAIAYLISYWVVTFILSPLVDPADALLGGMWATVATVFVFRVTRADSLSAGMDGLIATCISFALCLAYLAIWPFHPAGLAALLGLGTLIMICLGRRDDITTTGITTAVVMVAAAISPQHAWHQPVLRRADTVAGIAVGVLCKWIASWLYNRVRWKEDQIRRRFRSAIIFFAVAFGPASLAHSETPAPQLPGEYPDYLFREPFPRPIQQTNEDFSDKYLFGDWLGVRSDLAAHGIRPQVLFIIDPFGNISGGLRRGFSEYNLLALDLILEIDKLIGWPGGQVHVGFANNSGTSLSTNYVGNNFPIQLADVASAAPRLTYLSYTQSLLDDKLSIRFGRLTINSVYGEEFAGSQYFKAFTSVAFDLVPLGIFENAPGAFGYPLTTWGARVKVEPTDSFYAMVGCYNGDPGVKEGDHQGADFTMRGPPFVIGEIGFRRNYGKYTTGLPGNLKAGGYWNGGSAAVFGSGAAGQTTETVRGRYGFYVLGDQAIVRWGDAQSNRHLGVFAAFVCAPDERVNPMPYFFDAGVVAYGFLTGRPRDYAGVAVAYGSYSGDLRQAETMQALHNPGIGVQTFEMTVELTYGWTVRPGLLVQPDLQYIVNPGGNHAIANALAVGMNVVFNF